MADLLGSSFKDAFLRRINDEKERIKEHLAEGTVEDYNAFKRLTGVIEGLNLAEREFKEVFEIIENS
jgi:hypothetical protein|tara:strand:+ start:218 stop:418 length:201 start_codon:yes stop_codon:yes gene_type:complete